MQRQFRIHFGTSVSNNLKSKIKNRKLVGIVALVVTLTMGGAVATAQQTEKIPRIGLAGCRYCFRCSTAN
jgi:hypothetical protein